jgi:molybdenum cofactor cytidylyltransferase
MSNQTELKKTISLILLAAGSSSRMGQPKQLLVLENEPLLLRSTKAVLSSGSENVTVVLGDNEKEHRSVISHLPVQIVVNQDWQKGMGSSIKTGLRHVLKNQPDVEAIIISVCDQPLLTSSHLNKIIAAYVQTHQSVVASYYSNSAGVPALFDKKLFSELLNIEDGQGAKVVLNKHSENLGLVDFPDGEIDLDTWKEYQNFISQRNS